MPAKIPKPDAVVRLADVRRVIATAREYRDRYPALGMLADNVPSTPGGFDLDADAGDGARLDGEPEEGPSSARPEPEAFDMPPGREPERPDLDGDPARLAFDAREWSEAAAWFAGASAVIAEALAARRPDPAKRADRRAAGDAAKAVMRERVEPLAELVASGELSPADFRNLLRREVKDVHIAAAVAARGGDWGAMTKADWGRVGGRIGRQYGYAERFASDIADRAKTDKPLSAAAINQRAGLYADAASHSFEAQEVANTGVDPTVLPYHPGDGTTDCLVRCRCTWTLRILSAKRGDFNARWTLGSAEHCRTCLARGRAWRVIKVRGGKLVGQMPAA